MAQAVIASGSDYAGSPAGLSNEGTLVAGTQYGPFSDPAGDISDTRISPKMTFVGRYIARPGSTSFLITKSELTNLNNAGVSVCFICENVININVGNSAQSNASVQALTATQAYDQGVADAQSCQSNLTSVIGSSSWPVYFAMDFDVNSNSYANIAEYFSGAVSVLGENNVGIYGGGAVWQMLTFQNNLASWFWQSESIGYPGNGSYVAGQNIWQWPGTVGDTGYNPTGTVYVGTYSVDGDCAFDVKGDGWFGQYPKPGSTIGVLTTLPTIDASVTFSTPSLQTIVVPNFNYDQVLFSDSFSTTQTFSGVTSFVYPNQSTYPDTLNQYFYIIGNFSATVNGTPIGTNDFGYIFPNTDLYGYGYYLGNMPAVMVQPSISDSGQLVFYATYNPPQSGDSNTATIDFNINFALLKYPGTTTPVGIAPAGKTVGYQSAVGGIDTGVYSTYRRIDNEYVVTPTGYGSFPHNQNNIPDLFYWLIDTSGGLEIQPSTWTNTGPNTLYFGLAMDATNVYYLVDSANAQCNIRIYKDT